MVRHAQSYANKRDFTAFGNQDSPLTERGIAQASALNAVFRGEFGIVPEEYQRPVAVSEYTRAQQTAKYAGFLAMDVVPLINESDVDRDIMSGTDVIKKHKHERWVPDETAERAHQLYERIQTGDFAYEIYFTHGMFKAGFLLECSRRSIELPVLFTDDRGYVPLQATVTKVTL